MLAFPIAVVIWCVERIGWGLEVERMGGRLKRNLKVISLISISAGWIGFGFNAVEK